MEPTPFVKWAGGKRQLLPQYGPLFPNESDYDTYIEPFVGGGAVFFHLWSEGALSGKRVILNDINKGLMNCYRVIKDAPEALVAELKKHEQHREPTGEFREEYYYKVRGWDREKDFSERSDAEGAARTIFLNRTCYNGLYRVNSKGQFNVPYGCYKNPTILNEKGLWAVSKALQGVELRSEDFSQCLRWIQDSGTFVYLDPPYQPLSETASFTSYAKGDFDGKDQRRLARVFGEITERGCRAMLSNSATPLIRELYRDYTILEVQANRAISSNAQSRSGITELVILNYDISPPHGLKQRTLPLGELK